MKMQPVARLAPIVFVGISALFLAGCERSDKSPYFGATERRSRDPSVFYVNNGIEPEYLDPGKSTDGGASALIVQIFEGLTVSHPANCRPAQGVASHFEQSENRLFRFHLRKEARWSDGKPVTANDFEYAWKRVLRPSSASRAAASLYVLKNGEPFASNRLKVTKRALSLRTEPRDGAAEFGPAWKPGTAVEIVSQSPLNVATAIAPLSEPPASVLRISHIKADPSQQIAEQLSFDGGRAPLGPAADGGLWGSEVLVLKAGPPVDCDGIKDHWFLIQRERTRGYLPGCLLTETKSSRSFALVRRYERLPTFAPRRPGEAVPSTLTEEGFVKLDDLVEDDRVVGVRAVDDSTLEVELEQPTPFFLDLTGTVNLSPVRKDIVEAFEGRGEGDLWTRPENIVTNGPYVLDEWKFRYEITMKQNPHYWGRRMLKIDRIVWLEIDDYHTTMNLYKTGEIDYIGDNLSPPAEYLATLKTKKDYLNYDYLAVYWYDLNLKKPPLNDVRVRRALNLAIDKRQITEKIERGGQRVATHYVPDFTALGYSEQAEEDRKNGVDPFSGPELEYNPDLARRLLKEAGFEVTRDGDSFRAEGFPRLEILYNTYEAHRNIAVAVQDMWKRNLGIVVAIRNEEWKILLKDVRDGNYQIARGGWTGDYNHPHTFLEQFTTQNPQNWTGYADATFDDVLAQAASAVDPKESIRLYRKAEAIALAATSRIPFYFYTRSTLVKPWVKGFYGLPFGNHRIQFLWIDPSWKEHPENTPAYTPPELPPPGAYSP